MQAELHAAVVREVAGVRERLLVEQEAAAAIQLSRAHEAREQVEARLAAVTHREKELAALAADLDRREGLLIGAVRSAAQESAETIIASARRQADEIVARARAEAEAENRRRADSARAAREVRNAFGRGATSP
jgi:hypothetical protein